MIDPGLLDVFQSHATKVRDAARAKRDAVALKHVVDDPELRDDAIDDNTLGKRLPGERFAGDTALRTLNQLLAMVDQRGFERCATHFVLTGARTHAPTPPPLGPGPRTRSASTRR